MFKRKKQVIKHLGAFIVRVGFPYWHYRVFVPDFGCIACRDTLSGAYRFVNQWFNEFHK